MEKQIVGLLEHVEILSQNISNLEFPFELSLATANEAEQSLFAVRALQEKVRKYQTVAYSLNKELKKYTLVESN